MGKPEDLAIADARRDIAAVMNRFTEIALQAVDGLDAAQVKEAFALPKKDAPAWTAMVEKIVGTAARTEGSNPSTVNNTLQINLVGKAQSTEQWLDAVKQMNAPKLPPIDVKVEEK